MVNTGAGTNIFRVVENILLEEIQNQAHGYFGLLGIGNFGINLLPIPLTVSYLTHLYENCGTSAIEIIFFDRVRSDIISKAIEV